jgi:FkbM family methyltransferase
MALSNTLRFIANHPLNQGNKLAALKRYFRWQIGSRLLSGQVVHEWVNGARFLVRAGETGLTGNIYTGLHEFEDMGFLLHFLRADDLFVDVGANVGSYTILAGAAVGARCYAFEPVPDTFARLVDNLRLNHLDDRARCVNVGVGAEDGELWFSSDLDTVNHVLAADETSAQAVKVRVAALDSLLGDESPALIKIDVEGFETPVLDGAQVVLSRSSLRAVIMELNGSGTRYGFDEQKILARMADYGFGTYSYNPFGRALVNLRGKNVDSGNTLFIRDEASVLARLRAAPRVEILGASF